MRSFPLALLLATVSLFPAQAQDVGERQDRAAQMENRGDRRETSRERTEQAQEQAQSQEQSAQREAPQIQQPARQGRNWGRRDGGMNTAPFPPATPQAPPVSSRNWEGRGRDANRGDGQNWDSRNWNGGGGRDRNDGQGSGDVRPQPNNGSTWDRNGNGRVDRDWDRNRNGQVDRAWDRNRDGNLDRRSDRDGNGTLDRRYDRDGDGRYDRNRTDNRSYGYGNNNQRWDRGWHNDRRYDWRGHRNQYRQLYRAPSYYNPYGRGYGYNRFSIGIYLDSLFYSNRYWINDPWQYRLPQAYGSYRWVRYYDDVLLIDTRTGYVVDVINNFFW